MKKSFIIPDQIELLKNLHAGEEILLHGIIYSARDQAHARLNELLNNKEPLPIPLNEALIYYMGPSPTKPGDIVGSAGPTTAGRMDAYTPRLLDLGLKGMIGKGPRNQAVLDSMKQNASVYLYAFGGCGALYAEQIIFMECVAFDDLGPEAIYKLTVKDFPVIVAIDAKSNSIFK